jgi:hypothetical protein
MNAVPFDTLKMAHQLEEAGFPARQATGATEALVEALVGAGLATRSDILAVKSELPRLEASIRGEMAALRSELMAAMELLRRDMTINFGSMMVIGVGVLLAAIRYLPPHP